MPSLSWTSLCAVAFTAFSALVASQGSNCSLAVGSPVNTTSGLIYGHGAHNASQVSEYLGIRYAQPPTGNLRFAPPQKYSSSETVNATSFGHDCAINIQVVPGYVKSAYPNVYYILSQLAQEGDTPSEDCLFLNVWSKPQVGAAKKPVLVWIYGGGFAIGGTNTSAYSGQFWCETEDVIFVNFNYRLNVFGFSGAPDLTQNVGLLDQRAALEWVRTNIAAFGGDPSRITIFGQSAGGASVDYYHYAWVEDPIIAASIMQSGTANSFGNRAPAQAAANWYKLTAAVGCGTNATSSPAAVTACMRQSNITTSAIIANLNAGTGLTAVLGHFGPTIDERVVFSNYTARALAGNFTTTPVLIGNNDYEAGLFKLIAAGAGETLPESEWLDFDLGSFTCPSDTAAYLRAIRGVPVWRYRYFGMFPNLELPTSEGLAWHGAELLPLFGSSEEITKQDSTYMERALGNYLRGAWCDLARCPQTGLTTYRHWPKYDRNESSLILLGMNGTTATKYVKHTVYDTDCPAFYNGNPAIG